MFPSPHSPPALHYLKFLGSGTHFHEKGVKCLRAFAGPLRCTGSLLGVEGLVLATQ